MNQLPCAIRTSPLIKPKPAKFARATASASVDKSVSQTSVLPRGNSLANDKPITPLPVPKSAIRNFDTDRCILIAKSSATCATISVSGRGISTRLSTKTSRCRKAHRRITYCNGSPVKRRATIARSATPHRSLTTSSRAASNSPRSNPLACSHNQRASCSLPNSAALACSNSPQVIDSSPVTTKLILARVCQLLGLIFECQRVYNRV